MTHAQLSPYRHPVEVRFNDLDGMGHVNNALYHTFVEQARCRFLVAAGLWSGSMVPGQFPIILARTEMDFLAPVLWGEPLEVLAWIQALGRSSFTMGYVIRRDEQAVAAATAVLVWYDYDTGKSCPLPTDKAEKLRALVLDGAEFMPKRR